jgi:L-ascorbate metabolism protein UlaG (beta-lactamase superfamily)
MAKMIPGFLFLMAAGSLGAQSPLARDTFPAKDGDVSVIFVGHGTLVLSWGSLVVHVDPVGEYADYAKMPKADLVLVTHDHADHLDAAAIAAIRKPGTEVVLTAKCAVKVKGTVMANGDRRTFAGIAVEAVPAYNIRHERAPGKPYHPKGEGNGYVVTLGGLRIYVAGDTEDTPEMRKLEGIDVAFLPMNLPYTMTPEMVADAARAFKPKVLYPYHYGDTDPKRLATLLAGVKGIEVRIRSLK